MMLDKNKVEEVANEIYKTRMDIIPELGSLNLVSKETCALAEKQCFKAGVEYAESQFVEMFIDIITENQGLKLYKDNEHKRFEELAIEFADWIKNEVYLEEWPNSHFQLADNKENEEISSKELFKEFLKQRDED